MSAILDVVDVGHPYVAALPGARGKLLAVLVQLEKPATVRSLAGHAGISPQTALNLVDELAQAGLVHTERAGGSVLAALNRDHILAEPIEELIRSRGRLIGRLSEALARWPRLAAAWLFGSAARGDGDRSSDIDLLLVADTSTEDDAWTSAVGILADQVQAWTGNHAQVAEYSWAAFVQLVRGDNPIIAAIRADGIALTPLSRDRLRGIR
jgi:predicted nucleotidyltransferase